MVNQLAVIGTACPYSSAYWGCYDLIWAIAMAVYVVISTDPSL